jgi:hypothetical protein
MVGKTCQRFLVQLSYSDMHPSSTMSTPSTSTVSSALWAHLLRKDKPTVLHSPASIPIAPVDKTGTSMRLLLHDTQSTLEKFSEKIDNLIKGVEDTRSQALDNHQGWADDIERSTKIIVGEAGGYFGLNTRL